MTARLDYRQSRPSHRTGPLHVRRYFLWLALPLYLAYALLTPAFQTPDEPQHLFRAWQLSELQLIGERRGNESGGVLPGGLGAATLAELGTLQPHARKPVPERSGWLPRGTPADAAPPFFHNFLGSVIYSPVSYLPQVGVIAIGRAADWPVETIVLAGRVANALLFLLLFGYAIRLTPWGGPAFLFIGLHPTTVSSTATFGQDGLVIGSSALLVAVGLRVMLSGRWSGSSLLTLAGAGAGIALTKFLYLPLMVTAGLFAGRDLKGRLREAVPMVAIAIAAALLAAGWLMLVKNVTVPPTGDVLPTDQRLTGFLSDPTEFMHAFAGTYSNLSILFSAYSFAWLTVGPVPIPLFVGTAAMGALLLVGGDGMQVPNLKQRAWLLLIGLGMIVLVSFAMWLYYTPVGADHVRGVQARYLLPSALVMLPALLPRTSRSPRALFWMMTLLVIANAGSLMAIVGAFYVL